MFLALQRLSRLAQHNLLPIIGIQSPILKEYQTLLDNATLRSERIADLDVTVGRIADGKPRYEAAATELGNGIPWWFIGITHFMEAGGTPNPFNRHLHCGDPLTGRTFHIPAGRPLFNPKHGKISPSIFNPYSWQESAIDALTFMGYNKVKDWSVPNCLYLFEKYNGGGYKKRKINSPYVWSYTNQYGNPPNIGKYVADGHFDPNVISKQAGTAALYLRMLQKGLI